MKVNAILLKPLDGDPVGATRDFDQADYDRLEKLQAVRRASGGGDAVPTTETITVDAQAYQTLLADLDGTQRTLLDGIVERQGLQTRIGDLEAEAAEREAAVGDLIRERDTAVAERDAARAEATEKSAGVASDKQAPEPANKQAPAPKNKSA